MADLSLDKEILQDIIKRTLYGLRYGDNWLIICVLHGRSASAVRAVFCKPVDPAITTKAVPHRRPF